uniref:Uncharacterized protein n=1 Tax=Oryza rufipogon TaxID=4529 RepID=A0A0E0QY72_ORYRU
MGREAKEVNGGFHRKQRTYLRWEQWIKKLQFITIGSRQNPRYHFSIFVQCGFHWDHRKSLNYVGKRCGNPMIYATENSNASVPPKMTTFAGGVSSMQAHGPTDHHIHPPFKDGFGPSMNQTRVKPERLVQGLSPRYCALSLVVEPNMYPEINVLIVDLHRRHISTFLVSNAQFPDKIKTLKPINHVIFELRYVLAFKCSKQQALKISVYMVATVCQCGRSYKGNLENCR